MISSLHSWYANFLYIKDVFSCNPSVVRKYISPPRGLCSGNIKPDIMLLKILPDVQGINRFYHPERLSVNEPIVRLTKRINNLPLHQLVTMSSCVRKTTRAILHDHRCLYIMRQTGSQDNKGFIKLSRIPFGNFF